MNDARGRPIEVGDWIATPELHINGGIVEDGAILGPVVEVSGNQAYLGDGITYEGREVHTLGGYMWYICLDCNTPSPIDVRAGTGAVCSFCESERMVEDGRVMPHTVAELGL